MTEDQLKRAQSVLAAQPFSEFIGARISRYDNTGVTLELDIATHHRQQFGYVHGGVLSYLADNALTFAGGVALGPNVLTASVTLNYLSAARDGTLFAEAVTTQTSGNRAITTCDIICVSGGERVVCATAMGTIVRTKNATESSAQN